MSNGARRITLTLLCGLVISILAGCGSTPAEKEKDGYAVASPVLQREIDQRIANLQFLHGKDHCASITTLIYIGEPANPSLVAALQHDDPETRAAIAYTLDEIGDQRTVRDIRTLMDDPIEM